MAAVRPVFHLQRVHWDQMRADIDRHLPEEACGLVAGREGRSLQVFSVENALHSPVRFRMDPEQQLEGLLEIEAQGWDLAAIYHSHPSGPPVPSPTDTAEAAFPESIYLIWSQKENEWTCRGFYILDGQFEEVKVEIFDPE